LRVVLDLRTRSRDRNARLLRVPSTEAPGVAQKDARSPLSEPAKRKAPKGVFSKIKINEKDRARASYRASEGVEERRASSDALPHTIVRNVIHVCHRASRGPHCGSAGRRSTWPQVSSFEGHTPARYASDFQHRLILQHVATPQPGCSVSDAKDCILP
jgi:hypothetical protein